MAHDQRWPQTTVTGLGRLPVRSRPMDDHGLSIEPDSATPTPLPVGSTLETALCSVVGVAVSGGAIRWLLQAADTRWGRLVIGWAFVLPAGVLDTITNLFGGSFLTRTSILTFLAALIGGITGYMGGRYQVYDWKRRGWLQFLADLTWGLSGSAVAALMHVWNALQKLRPLDRRQGAHRYGAGFTTGKRFSFTQGNVMSNLRSAPGEPLFIHEQVHVLQSRLFGPIYPITYVAWSIVGLVLALVVSLFAKEWKSRIDGWSYFSNPWETWAYAKHGRVQALRDGPFDGSDQFRKLFNPKSFKNGTVVGISMIFFPALFLLFIAVLAAAF
jgi:hypothetical protein